MTGSRTSKVIASAIAAILTLFFAPSALAACSNPSAPESVMVYNADHKVMQYCNGTDWINMGVGSGGGATPSGMVAFFAGGSCPSGWSAYSAADGRFVIATGTLGSDTYNLSDTGGSARHTLTTNEMPSHEHGVGVNYGGAGSNASRTIAEADYESEDRVGDTRHAGGGNPHENRPPYIALTTCKKD